ncbi:peptide ABC transporter permease [Microbacterium faecale]|uniref:Peptide ABC transporter permease n=1 Tax=Microbacterium faecale TaxID=1804630 RepID=A0A917DE15_9MICO|nr:peptide ABC transporter permease [Microbacterium faecale]
MPVLYRVVRRVAEGLLTLLIASVLIFGAMYVAPGSLVATLLGGPESVNAESIRAITEAYHLDEPFVVQYWYWLEGVLQGSFGRSYVYGLPVTTMLATRLETTGLLLVLSYTVIIGLGITFGILSATRRGRTDRVILVGTTFGSAIPQFVVALVLIGIFGVELGWFPVSGTGTGFADRLYHMVLPTFAVASVSLAVITRVTRQSMLDAFSQDHVEAARIRGIKSGPLVRRHVFRNALGPVMTMSGLILAGMLGGSVLVETVFGLNGVGSLLVDAINNNDFPVVQAVLLLMVGTYVVVTMIMDLLYPLVDPRVARKEKA